MQMTHSCHFNKSNKGSLSTKYAFKNLGVYQSDMLFLSNTTDDSSVISSTKSLNHNPYHNNIPLPHGHQ